MKISIIIPVFNSEKSIKRCIDSIIDQTYTNLEIIIVDDGSTDKSGKICDDYAKKDSRICVFHKENGGVSSARNFGLSKVTGDFISFVDSDDYLEKDMYEKSVNAIHTSNSDIVTFGFVREDESGNKINKLYHKFPNKNLNFSRQEFVNTCYKYSTIDFFLCNKIYSKKLIINDSFSLKFNEKIYMSEDALFNVELVDKNVNFNCTFINEKLYHYVIGRTNFTSQKLNPKKLTYLLEKNQEIKLLSKNEMDDNISKAYYVIFYNNNKRLFEEREFSNDYNSWYFEYKKSISFLKLPLKLKIKYIFSNLNYKFKRKEM